MNRKVASAKAAISGIVLNILTAILGIITQRIFIDTLGIEYSGINGLFTSIVSILTLADLGVSTAVIFHLYKPFAIGDKSKIAALIQYYHKACRIISGIIIVGGLFLLPLAPLFVGETTTIHSNIYVIFALFIINALFSYTLNYRRPILNADQKGYIINWTITGSSILLYALKVIILVTTQNFYLYTLATIVCKIIENLIINRIVDKKYPYIHTPKTLDKVTLTDIKKKMYASVFHNSASYVLFSTDNVIIAQFFGILQVGLYANYFMIIRTLNQLLTQLFGAMTASLGNILASEGPERLYVTTKRIMLLNFWLYAVAGIALYYCITPFIKLWLGADFLFVDSVTVMLALNFYIQGVRAPINSVFSASGVIYENRFTPIFEAIINIVVSIALALVIGLPGVFIGTAISGLFLHLYGFPKFGFELVLKKKKSEYILLFLKYFGLFIVVWIGMGGIMQLIDINNNLVEFIVKGSLSLVIPSLCYWGIFRKSEEFLYFSNLGKRLVKRKLLKDKRA
jgi:O-antigen/teichoic acid export membrane protein